MENKKSKKFLIPLIIGIIIGCIGVSLIVKGAKMSSPDSLPMSSVGWFENEAKKMDIDFAKSSLISIGSFIAFFGFFVIGIAVTCSVYYSSSHKQTNVIEQSKQHVENVKSVFQQNGININKNINQLYTCKYCGTRLDGKDKKCPGCGAPNDLK